MSATRDELRQAIEDARRKNIEVVAGAPYTADELDAVAARLGVAFPADYRLVALEHGSLSFRVGEHHYAAFGKGSAATQEAGMQLDVVEMTTRFRAGNVPFSADTEPAPVALVAAMLNPAHGHFEYTLVDADGAYRTLFHGGEISEPRTLVSVAGIFPYFAMMYRDDGTPLSAAELLARISGQPGDS